MLRHRRPADRQVAGKLSDRMRPRRDALKDRSPGRVAERPEHGRRARELSVHVHLMRKSSLTVSLYLRISGCQEPPAGAALAPGGRPGDPWSGSTSAGFSIRCSAVVEKTAGPMAKNSST